MSPSDTTKPERELLAAILILAIADAREGSAEAAVFLAEVGPSWAEWLGVDPETLASWSEYGGGCGQLHRVKRGRAPKERTDEARERDRLYQQAQRKRKRQAKEAERHGTDNQTDPV